MAFSKKHATAVISEISRIINENEKLLSDLDSKIGDGDLGITMKKAFNASVMEMSNISEEDPGKFFARIGMVIAKAAPSTMGTLVATGFMKGGKAVSGKNTLSVKDLTLFFTVFTEGIQQRGKASPGEKTILDVLIPVTEGMSSYNGDSLAGFFAEAEKISSEALENTKNMVSQHGKAAVFREATLGIQDPGGTVANLIIKGFLNTAED